MPIFLNIRADEDGRVSARANRSAIKNNVNQMPMIAAFAESRVSSIYLSIHQTCFCFTSRLVFHGAFGPNNQGA